MSDLTMAQLWQWAREHVGVASASKIAEAMIAKDPALIAEYLEAHRLVLVTRYVGDMERSARYSAVARRRATFADAAEAFEAGEVEAISPFAASAPFAIGKSIGEMTGTDHREVARGYTASGTYDLLLAKVHKAVARKCGSKRTDEVFTEEEYVSVFERMGVA